MVKRFRITGLAGNVYAFKETQMEYLRCPYCRVGNIRWSKKRMSDKVNEWTCSVCGMVLEEEDE